jgi:hypothetical protein
MMPYGLALARGRFGGSYIQAPVKLYGISGYYFPVESLGKLDTGGGLTRGGGAGEDNDLGFGAISQDDIPGCLFLPPSLSFGFPYDFRDGFWCCSVSGFFYGFGFQLGHAFIEGGSVYDMFRRFIGAFFVEDITSRAGNL